MRAAGAVVLLEQDHGQYGGRAKPRGRTAAKILNDRVLPLFEQHGIALNRAPTDRGREYCGNPEHHGYELHLAIEAMDHTRTLSGYAAGGWSGCPPRT